MSHTCTGTCTIIIAGGLYKLYIQHGFYQLGDIFLVTQLEVCLSRQSCSGDSPFMAFVIVRLLHSSVYKHLKRTL